MSILDAASVLFVHAHPDDETLATGALIAEAKARGATVSVLVATRGERGEVVPGPLSDLVGTPELIAERVRELTAAVGELGVDEVLWLGTPPARAAGAPPRDYEDSGMRWVTPTLAGPAADTGPFALTTAPAAEVAADIGAAIDARRPGLVVTYDHAGGYGHPDHVRIHEATLAACRDRGQRLAEVVIQPGDRVEWYDGAAHRDRVVAAVSHHRTQVTVDGDDVVHSGGQRERLTTARGLRILVEG